MNNNEIENTIREHGYVLPFVLYREICNSHQVDHVKRDGEWYEIWTKDGYYWKVLIEKENEL